MAEATRTLLPFLLEPQPEGGYTVTSPLLLELLTEGDTADECLVHAEDAFAAVVEIYEDFNEPLPVLSEWHRLTRLPLVLEPQPEGGFTVTSPLLPELITEGDTARECFTNAQEAFELVLEIYADREQPLPPGVVTA